MHYLKTRVQSPKCTGKKILLISDVGCPSNADKLDVIIDNLKNEGIEFNFFGPEWIDDDGDNDDDDVDGNNQVRDNPVITNPR